MPVVRMEPPLATDSARASSASAVASSQRSGDNNLEDQSGGRRRTEQEEDALMNEMLSKHRSELQKFIGRAALVRDGDDDDDDDDDHDASHFSDAESPPPPPPPLTASANSGDFHSETYVELPSPDGFSTPRPVRSKTAERLLELSRTEEAARTDRMRLADLSDVRNERLGREVISRWNPEAKVKTHRPHALATTSPRPSAKLLGYSKDFVQQALDFNGHDMDEDDDDALALAGVDVHDGGGQEEVEEEEHFRGGQSQVELRRYVKQMEATIAQLVQQKDELLRNQAEFDKHASGIFPSLEHLNHQLSQIVQGKMATSQVNIKEDVFDEIRIQGEKLEELESETKRRHHDADVLEQSRAIEMTQIKGQIVSLVASGKLRDEKVELVADSVEKLQLELQDTVKTLVERSQLLEKRVHQPQSPMAPPHLKQQRSSCPCYFFTVFALIAIAFLAAVAFSVHGSCNAFTQCAPLT